MICKIIFTSEGVNGNLCDLSLKKINKPYRFIPQSHDVFVQNSKQLRCFQELLDTNLLRHTHNIIGHLSLGLN